MVTGTATLLQEFYADKLKALQSHKAAARLVTGYDFNNTYQYIINREETELSWVAGAIEELGARPINDDVPEPDRGGSGSAKDRAPSLFTDDAREAQAFVDRWKPRIDGMTNARHARMLGVILGEALEQKRFFEQALAGQVDLLGRRTEETGPRVGKVLPTRWIG
jgi:hypothetical protein